MGQVPHMSCEGNLGSAELKMLSDCVKLKLLLSVNCCVCAIGFHEIKKPSGRVDASFPDRRIELVKSRMFSALSKPNRWKG